MTLFIITTYLVVFTIGLWTGITIQQFFIRKAMDKEGQ